MQQISRDKTDRLQSATAEFTTSALDGYGLRCQLPARPAPYASYPVLVHRLASLLHASFRPHLTMTPLRFAITSPPSGCEGDLHPQAVNHARRTTFRPPFRGALVRGIVWWGYRGDWGRGPYRTVKEGGTFVGGLSFGEASVVIHSDAIGAKKLC